MQLRTARLQLRRPTPGDLDAFFEIMSNPSAMRYWSTLPHADSTVTRAWLERMVERELSGGQHFVIEWDGQVVGEVGAGRLPDFGFIIHPQFTDTAELKADVDPRNAASLRVLHKLGFRETGRASNTFLLGDEWCDSVYLALPRPRD